MARIMIRDLEAPLALDDVDLDAATGGQSDVGPESDANDSSDHEGTVVALDGFGPARRSLGL